ncbi:ATP-binding protein [Deinococcus planocerae]|uniref:ATP-binding protein n=1 Tax=Deinococcus planocerae TaxID=1737569 RepID=UPI000C7F59A6|nr:ATP-binding protein [Deinococcus planocerae]
MTIEAFSPPPVDGARRVYRASYSTAESDTWLDNPLIEALPPLMTDGEFSKGVRFFPPHDREMTHHPKHLRLMYIQRTLQFFVPMEKHLLLHQRLARIIRDGYIPRNPIHDLGWSRLHQQVEHIAQKLKYGIEQYEPPSALGFALIGLGGTGKTVAVKNVLRTYPKVLIHRTYTDSLGRPHHLMRTQIVFLRLDCPNDGTLKSLCLNFFKAVDELIGSTKYHKDYGFKGTRQRTATEMLPDMAKVAALHSIGLLIIDEIQFLSKQKSGGREQMLQWFTELVNTIKLPVVLIGTPRADEVLNSAFWQMRRNAGQGEGHWARMAQDGEWDRFLSSMWRYQFVKHPSRMAETTDKEGKTVKQVPRDLSEMLYDESQGIADFAVKMFMIAQERAINSGLEQLTPELIHQVAKDAFGKARIILQGIKNNDPKVLAQVDDVKFDLERLREKNTPRPVHAQGDVPPPVSPPEGPLSQLGQPEHAAVTPLLPPLVKDALTRGLSGMQGLRDAGYICSPTEFGF